MVGCEGEILKVWPVEVESRRVASLYAFEMDGKATIRVRDEQDLFAR